MKDNYRKTDYEFSRLIHMLYGATDYYTIKSHNNITLAKKFYIKILKSLRFSIEETIIVIDKKHKTELLNLVNKYEKLLKQKKSFDELDQSMITFQTELIFYLIGGIPHRWRSEKIINKKSIWKLDFFRSVQYISTPEQKQNIIFKAIQTKYMDRFGSWESFLQIYEKFSFKPEQFIDWFKTNYTDIYIELF
jgi:hypothetical protein